MLTTVALVLASVALAVATTAAAGVVILARQSGRTHSQLRRHRIAHHDVHGTPDPQRAEDRPRRGAVRYEAPTGMQPAVRPDGAATGHLEQQDLPTVEAARTRPRPTPREDPTR